MPPSLLSHLLRACARPAAALVLAAALLAPSALGQAARAVYPVDRFDLTYGRPNPGLPSPAQLGSISVPLVLVDGAYAKPGASPLAATPIRLDAPPPGAVYDETALTAVMEAIVRAINSRGIYAAFVVPKAEEIDATTWVDFRPPGHRDLTLVVWVGEIGDIRILDRGSPIGNHLRGLIAAHFPLHAAKEGTPGSLLHRGPLETYLWRLNEHPGRHVEASLTSSNDPGVIALDLLVSESRPWTVLAQVSNTGTQSTGDIRSRLGFASTEVTGSDDTLSLDYFTTTFKGSNAVFGSYERPLLFPNFLSARLYGSWGNFDSQPIGIAFERFSGNNWAGGGELLSVLGRPLGVVLEAVAGVDYQHFGVKSPTFGQSGSVSLFLPYVGLDLHRNGRAVEVSNSVRIQTNVPEIAHTQKAELANLGRLDIDAFWVSVRDDFRTSLFLDTLLFPRSSSRSNELYLAFGGQFVPSSYRLIPQELDVIGGFFSVRGYPEAVTSGDSAYDATVEYRFHLPRLAEHLSKLQRLMHLGSPRPGFYDDWDLIARGFVDAGEIINNRIQAGESNYQLLGTGVGVELAASQHFDVRVDGAYALKAISSPLQTLAEKDSFRLHVIATLSW
jgi:hypothetical protein